MRAAAVLVTVVLLTGCTGGDGGGTAGDGPRSASPSGSGASAGRSASTGPAGSASPSPRATDANGFPLPERPACAAESGGEFVTAATSDGNGVGILLLGDGAAGVVLSPQDGGDICMMLAYGEELAEDYRVALHDWKEPRPEVPLLAVDALRDAGVVRVVLGGASYGGALAMSQAHRVRPRPAGVLAIGGELRLPGEDFRPGIRRWRGPLLTISSREDFYFGSKDARELRTLHRGPETVLMLPGSLHAMDLLGGPHAATVRAAVDRYLARVLG